MAIRAVIFDMGGVLLRGSSSNRRLRALARLGLTEDLVNELFRGNPIARRSMIGQASRQESYAAFARGLRKHISLPTFMLKIIVSLQEYLLSWDEDLLDFIRQLRPKVKTALLSDAWLDTRERIRDYANERVFDVIVISAEEGVAKPDPEIYRRTLERLGVAPEEAIFIDDWPPNVEGARALGIHALLFTTPERAKAEIEQLLATG